MTEADRLRLRAEIDPLCADLYGLDPDDFDWIVRDAPTDPKGYYRVDRQLPFHEQLTGLAAAAFRALKEGKWTVDGGRKKTANHRPPSTVHHERRRVLRPHRHPGDDHRLGPADPQAGRLPHRWKPEEFGPDDPRHGWTWDDCWKDAVALLGSEEAVRAYIEGKHEKAAEEPHKSGPTDLFGEPLPPTQRKLF